MMLGIMRQARCGSAVSVMTRLAQSLIAADPPASSLHSATAAVAAQPLTNLRQFSPTQSFTGAWCSEVPSSGQHSMPHVHSAAFTTSSARRQDSQPSSALPAGLNPLQAIPGAEAGGNPLSVVPQPTEPPREPIAQAVLRSIKISPHKLADFARVVRRLHVEDAMVQCKASVKKPAKLVYKLLEAARANGVNNHGLDPDRLYVDHAVVGKAKYTKRTWFHGRGRVGVRTKYRAHCTIVLREHEAGPPPRRITRVLKPFLERSRSRSK